MKYVGKTKKHFITPVNQKYMKGFFVKIPGHKIVFISEKKYGKLTLEKAIEKRNELLKQTKYKYKYLEGKKSRNNTGIPGIREVDEVYYRKYKNGKVIKTRRYVFVATGTVVNGKLQQKCFSIRKYGRELAFKKALEERERILQSYSNCEEDK